MKTLNRQLGHILIAGLACDWTVMQKLANSIDGPCLVITCEGGLDESLSRLKSQLKRFACNEQLTHLSFVGHSMGGYVLQAFLSEALDNEALLAQCLIERIVLLATQSERQFKKRYTQRTFEKSGLDNETDFLLKICTHSKATDAGLMRAFASKYLRQIAQGKLPACEQMESLAQCASKNNPFPVERLQQYASVIEVVGATQDCFVSKTAIEELAEGVGVTPTFFETDDHMLVANDEFISYYNRKIQPEFLADSKYKTKAVGVIS